MSDPVTTAEVEDVLSSIRRLVSEEKRPKQQAETRPQANPVQPERLVLTPALRVEDPKPDVQGMAEQPTPAFHSERAGRLVLGAESAVTDPKPVADIEPVEQVVRATLEKTEEGLALPMDVPEDAEPPSGLSVEVDEQDMTLNMSEDDGQADIPPLTLEPQARSDAEWAADALAEAEAVAEAKNTPEAAPANTKAATLSAKIEALESAIGGIEDDFEPDEVSDDAYSGTKPPAIDWEDDVLNTDAMLKSKEDVFELDAARDTLRDMKEPVEEAVFAAATIAALNAEDGEDDDDFEPSVKAASEPPRAWAEEKVIDEDALRDMVSEIVRSELQGALGERITRNVRKLVRREIHRALTTQDLE